MQQAGKTIYELKVGDRAECEQLITVEDRDAYAKISADYNLLHFDEAFAQKTKFKRVVAHGVMVASRISGLIGMELPGPGCLYESQSMKFLYPVWFGDTIRTVVEITAIDLSRNRVQIRTSCYNQDGRMVIDGEAIVLPSKERRRE